MCAKCISVMKRERERERERGGRERERERESARAREREGERGGWNNVRHSIFLRCNFAYVRT